MPYLRARDRNEGASGFSLVEVTLALAILAIGVTAMIALIPSGQGNFRAAVDGSNETQVFDDLKARLLSISWSTFQTVYERTPESAPVLFYDRDGRFLGEKQNQAAIYAAKVLVEPQRQVAPERGVPITLSGARNVIMVVAQLHRPLEADAFSQVRSVEGLLTIGTVLRWRGIILPQMDAAGLP